MNPPPPPPPPPPTLVDSAGVVVRSVGAPVESPAAGQVRRYEFKLTPSVEGDDESTAYGAQILVKRERVSAGLTGQMVHADATDQLNPAAQGDLELTLVDEGRALGSPSR